MRFIKVQYKKLTAKQKENYNFQIVSGLLAKYGISTIRLTNDWQNADFLAQDTKGAFIKVQLKSRFTISKKYIGKNLYICFPSNGDWYIFPHDKVLSIVLKSTNVGNTMSWKNKGGYSISPLPNYLKSILKKYKR